MTFFVLSGFMSLRASHARQTFPSVTCKTTDKKTLLKEKRVKKCINPRIKNKLKSLLKLQPELPSLCHEFSTSLWWGG